MERLHPAVPAQREAAQWWLDELRSRTADAESEAEVRELVADAATRVSPTLLASAAFLAGIGALTETEEREGLGLLARFVAAETRRAGVVL